MFSAKIKDRKIRKSFSKAENFRKIRKFMFVNMLNNDSNEFSTSLLSSILKLKTSKNLKTKVKITNRCVLNNRGRSVLRPYGISKTAMRNLMQFGIIPGYSKAVW